jgi:hypothetical protein
MHTQHAFYFAHFRVQCAKDKKHLRFWLLQEFLKRDCLEASDDGLFTGMTSRLDCVPITNYP